ncbi:MAG: hypothetical protein ACQEXV_17635 [Bacillota bacterium]
MKFKATTCGLIILAVSASVLTVVITNSVLADHDVPIPNESVTYDPVPPADVLDRLYHPDKISANTSTTATQDAGTTTTGDHVVTPQKVRDVFNDMFDRKDPVSRFELDPGYGHLKIFVKNRGSQTITFSLVHKDSGKLYISKTVGAGRELSWNSLDSFSQGLRSGDYEIQWRAGGDIVKVTTWGVSGQYPSDIS